MNLTSGQIIELKELIKSAIQQLYINDLSLISRCVHERSIAFRFGLYFSKVLAESSFGGDNEITIDFDYNRNKDTAKSMQGFSKTHGVYPDIILHHRGYNDKNIVVIEFKGYWNNNRSARALDIKKLTEFTHSERNQYNYGLGLFVELGSKLEECKLIYFINGEQI